MHMISSPPALRIAASAPRSIAFERQTLEQLLGPSCAQLLGPSCAQYLADIHATDRQSHLIHYVWTHESGPLTPAEADAVCFHAFSCLPKAVEPTAPAAPAGPIGGAQSASTSHKGRFGRRQMEFYWLSGSWPLSGLGRQSHHRCSPCPGAAARASKRQFSEGGRSRAAPAQVSPWRGDAVVRGRLPPCGCEAIGDPGRSGCARRRIVGHRTNWAARWSGIPRAPKSSTARSKR